MGLGPQALRRAAGRHRRQRAHPFYLEREGIRLDPSLDADAFVAGLHQAKTAHYLALLGTGAIPLRPGVLRLLREARAAGVRLAIATTTTPENVSTLLDRSGEPGLSGWFEVIAAGDAVPAKSRPPTSTVLLWSG